MKIDKTHPRWDEITDDLDRIINEESRRGSNFFCNILYVVDDDTDMAGTWMSNRLIGDHEYGTPCEIDELTDLTKVVKRVKMVEQTTWVKA